MKKQRQGRPHPRQPAAELANIHNFNASGMVATTDIGNRTGSSCFMLDQFKSGKFVRVYPTKKGTFDCNKSNIYTFQDEPERVVVTGVVDCSR